MGTFPMGLYWSYPPIQKAAMQLVGVDVGDLLHAHSSECQMTAEHKVFRGSSNIIT